MPVSSHHTHARTHTYTRVQRAAASIDGVLDDDAGVAVVAMAMATAAAAAAKVVGMRLAEPAVAEREVAMAVATVVGRWRRRRWR